MTDFEPLQQAQRPAPDAIGLGELFTDPGVSFGAGPIPGVTPDLTAGGRGGPSASEQAFGPPSAGHPTLRQGSNGPSVRELQAKLDQRGETLAVDGVFGALTRAAVVRFQQANGLDPDGIVGAMTWGALDAQPAPSDPTAAGGLAELGGITGDDLDIPVGDAEGNLDDNGSGRELETLDRDGGETEALPGLASAGNVFGFGPAKNPSRPAPVANAAKAKLLSGGFADLGAYNAAGDGFIDGELDSLLADYGAFWGVDVRALATPDAADVSKPGAGDSAGKGVAVHPPWVKALQNKIIGRGKWDDDDRATQKLLEAFLRRFARDHAGLPPGAEQLFHQIGESETNGEAKSLGGFKDASNWCAQASKFALLLGMYNRGIRFKTSAHSADYGAEITKQVAAFTAWTHQAGHTISGNAAFTAQLEPGDIISVVNGGATGPLSGHVATVVEHTGDDVTYVSGNAAGVQAFEGAVRIEQVKREQPPAGYDWLALAGREKAFQGAKQIEKTNRNAAKQDGDILFNDQAIIQDNLPGVQFPDLDFHQHASVAAYVAVATAHLGEAKDALQVQTAVADMVFRSNKLNGEVGTADAAFTAEQGLLADGGLPVSRDPTVDPRIRLGTHVPKDAGTSWVVEVIRASALTALQVLASGATKTVPNDPALEACTPLAQQCPNAPPEVINQQAR